MTKCINLRERFGDRWQIEFENGYESGTDDRWYQIIPCEHGHICPWGGDLLAACTSKNGEVANKLRRLPFTEAVQDGDDGVNVTFSVDDIDGVDEIMKPKPKRPPKTQAQRDASNRNLARGSKHQFTAKNRPKKDLESPPGTRPDPEHTEADRRRF